MKKLMALTLALAAFGVFAGSSDKDENGLTPAYWIKFDGNVNNSGSLDITFKDTKFSYRTTRLGSAAYNSSTWVNYDMSLPADNGAWTLVETVRSVATDGNVVLGLGKRTEYGFALVSGGESAMRLCSWKNGANVKDLFNVAVADAVAKYHCYACVFDPAAKTVEFYVDGVSQGTAEIDGNPGHASMQLGSINSGLPTSLTNGESNKIDHDDFRLYQQALSSEQIAAIAKNYPPWKEPEGPQTATWIGGASGVWNNPDNWDIGLIPSSQDTAIIGSGADITMTGDANPSNLVVNARLTLAAASGWLALTPYEITGEAQLTLKNVDLRMHGGQQLTFANPIEIPEGFSSTFYADNANIELGGEILGAGTLAFTRNNGYTGVIFRRPSPNFTGTINLNHSASRHTFDFDDQCEAGFPNATVNLGNDVSILQLRACTNGVIRFARLNANNPQFRCQKGSVYTYVIGDDGAEGCTLNNVNFWRKDGNNISTVNLRKIGSSPLVFGSWNYNSFDLEGGTVTFTSTSTANLPNDELRFKGGVWTWGAGQTTPVDPSAKIRNSTGAIAIDTAGYDVTFAAALAESNVGGFVKKGEGKLTLAAIPAYTGDTTVEAGELVVPKETALAGELGLAEGAVLTVDATGVTEAGDYDVVTYAGLQAGTELTKENVRVVGLGGNTESSFDFSQSGKIVLKVTTETLVWNANGSDWTDANVWRGASSGTPYTYAEGDAVRFDVPVEAGAVNTALVSTVVAPGVMTVEPGGEGAAQLFLGHGTLAAAQFDGAGRVAFAGDAEGPLNLDMKLEGTNTAVFASGTVNLLTSLHMVSENNATLVRTADWTPSYAMTGSGKVVISNANFHVTSTSYFAGFGGTITLLPGGYLWDDMELHGEGKAGQATYGLGENVTVRMAGGRISRFGVKDGSNNEYLADVVVADGTTNEWYNLESRGTGGCHVNVKGDVSGGGLLKIESTGRNVKFFKDLSTFGGQIEIAGANYDFAAGIKGGTVIAKSGAVILTTAVDVDNATLILNNTNPNLAVTYSATATAGGGAATTVKSAAFEKGAKFVFTDEGALSDRSVEYVGLTAESITGKPLVDQPADTYGSWRTYVRENREEVEVEPGVMGEKVTYSLCAKWRPAGMVLMIR